MAASDASGTGVGGHPRVRKNAPLIRGDETMRLEAGMNLAVHPGYQSASQWAVKWQAPVGVTHASFATVVQSEIPQVVRTIGFFPLAPSPQPQEAEGQEARDLIESLGGGRWGGVERLAHAGDEMLASKRLLEAR
jgi:hypothetical protein